MPELKQRSDVESQTSPMKETLPQVTVSSTEPLLGNQTRSTLVPSLNDSKSPTPKSKQIKSTRQPMTMEMIKYPHLQ